MAYTKSNTDAVGAQVKLLGGPDAVITDDSKLGQLRAWGSENKKASEVEAWIMYHLGLVIEAASK